MNEILTCSKCKRELVVKYFNQQKGRKRGYQSQCKECSKESNKDWHKNNKDKVKEYRKKNIIYIREYAKKSYWKHKDKVLLYHKKHYQENKEIILKRIKIQRSNPETKFNQYQYSAEKRNISWDLTYKEFISFWKEPCKYCGGEIETIGLDRVNSQKGYTIENLVSCCTECNRMKGKVPFLEWVSKVQEIASNFEVFFLDKNTDFGPELRR